MGIAGAYRLGPESGRLLVHTTRTGLGAKAGHDLTIEVTHWHGHARVDTAVPVNSSVTIQVDVDSSKSGKEPAASSRSPTPTVQRSARPSSRSSTPPSIQPSPSGPGGSTGRRGPSPSTVS